MKKTILATIIAAAALSCSAAFPEEPREQTQAEKDLAAIEALGSNDKLSYTISSTGKRHNSTCRYYGKGRPAGPNEGIPCKICGG
jgi:hypothetical protein